jgi:hypothetical protein
MEFLDGQVKAFIGGSPDPFDTEVKKLAGTGNYRVTHSDGESSLAASVHDVLGDEMGRITLEEHFSGIYGHPIRIANICCSGCFTSDGAVSGDRKLAIQLAAVNTDPARL